MIISALGLLAALGTVLARNLVHAALFLVAFFFIVACQFVLLEAEFLAAIQVLVYIGAVAILLMFGIMLTRNVQGDDTTTRRLGLELPGAGRRAGAVPGARRSGSTTSVGPERPRALDGDRRTGRRSTPSSGQPPSPRAAAINNMGKAVGDELMTRFVVAVRGRRPAADRRPGRRDRPGASRGGRPAAQRRRSRADGRPTAAGHDRPTDEAAGRGQPAVAGTAAEALDDRPARPDC